MRSRRFAPPRAPHYAAEKGGPNVFHAAAVLPESSIRRAMRNGLDDPARPVQEEFRVVDETAGAQLRPQVALPSSYTEQSPRAEAPVSGARSPHPRRRRTPADRSGAVRPRHARTQLGDEGHGASAPPLIPAPRPHPRARARRNAGIPMGPRPPDVSAHGVSFRNVSGSRTTASSLALSSTSTVIALPRQHSGKSAGRYSPREALDRPPPTRPGG